MFRRGRSGPSRRGQPPGEFKVGGSRLVKGVGARGAMLRAPFLVPVKAVTITFAEVATGP